MCVQDGSLIVQALYYQQAILDTNDKKINSDKEDLDFESFLHISRVDVGFTDIEIC